MSKTQVGSCPHCGAPIYVPSVWFGITAPPNEYTCNCVEQPKTYISTSITAPQQAKEQTPSNTLPEDDEGLKKIFKHLNEKYKWDTPFTGILKEYSGFIHAGVAKQLQGAYERDIRRLQSAYDRDIKQAQTDLLKELEGEVEALSGRIPNGKGIMIPDFYPNAEGLYKGKWIDRDDILALLRKRLNNE